jgi:hypothetical protein
MVHVPLMFLSEWREFPSAPFLAGGGDLMTARVAMLLKSRASPDMRPFSLCNKKRLPIRHMNRPVFPTTQSIPSYNIGKEVGLRTYQHPLVCGLRRYSWIVFHFLSRYIMWVFIDGILWNDHIFLYKFDFVLFMHYNHNSLWYVFYYWGSFCSIPVVI